MAAVNRCACTVPRHHVRLILLTYQGKGVVEKTLYLVGKGITYDTGGADIKAGGVMAVWQVLNHMNCNSNIDE